MMKAGEERRQGREAKLQDYQKLASSEEEFREGLLKEIKNLNLLLAQSMETDKLIIQFLKGAETLFQKLVEKQ